MNKKLEDQIRIVGNTMEDERHRGTSMYNVYNLMTGSIAKSLNISTEIIDDMYLAMFDKTYIMDNCKFKRNGINYCKNDNLDYYCVHASLRFDGNGYRRCQYDLVRDENLGDC